MRALVIGIAETGVAVTERLRREHVDVTIVDDAPAPTVAYEARRERVADAGAVVVEAPSPDEVRALVTGVDLVVPSPLVRPDHLALVAAQTSGISVRSEIDLAGERAHAPIVAVTGTNGKTTVTSMIAAMLAASGVRAVAAGNIGRPLIEAVDDDADVLVAEVSSFQLALSSTFRPRVAVLLAITPDHLDWHGGFAAYVAAKARICAHQAGDDVLVFDAHDPEAAAIGATAPARSIGVTATAEKRSAHYRVDGDALVFPNGNAIARLRDLKRALSHDRTNALAAAAAAFEAGATLDGIRATLASYETLPHRVTLVGEARGVQWYDDSKATNPDATLRAVASFPSVVLLAGGRNKGLDLSVLGRASDHVRAVVAMGECAPDIVAAFTPGTTVAQAASMHDAVRLASEFARPGDVVLLSPACASFDAYDNYGQRGDDFAAEVRVLLDESVRR